MYFKHVQFHYAKTLSLKALPFEFASKKTNHIIGSLLTRIQHNQQGFGSEDAAVVTCVGGGHGLQCAGHSWFQPARQWTKRTHCTSKQNQRSK